MIEYYFLLKTSKSSVTLIDIFKELIQTGLPNPILAYIEAYLKSYKISLKNNKDSLNNLKNELKKLIETRNNIDAQINDIEKQISYIENSDTSIKTLNIKN